MAAATVRVLQIGAIAVGAGVRFALVNVVAGVAPVRVFALASRVAFVGARRAFVDILVTVGTLKTVRFTIIVAMFCIELNLGASTRVFVL
jgi:hypothetical protein